MKPWEGNIWTKTWRRWGSELPGCLREEGTTDRTSPGLVWACPRSIRPLWQEHSGRQREERRLAGLALWAILSVMDFTESEVTDNLKVLNNRVWWANKDFKRTTLAGRLCEGKDKGGQLGCNWFIQGMPMVCQGWWEVARYGIYF